MSLPQYNPDLTLREAREQFNTSLEMLLRSPSQESVLDMEIASHRLTDVLERIALLDGGIPQEYAKEYINLTAKAIKALGKVQDKHARYYGDLMRIRIGCIKDNTKKY